MYLLEKRETVFFTLFIDGIHDMASLTIRDLAREIEQINTAIRAEPLEASHRLALAQLRLVQGEYQKALQQLQLACQFDAELAPEAQLTRMLVRAEQTREAVFAGKILPDLLAPAPVWLESMIGALRQSGEEAAQTRRAALEAAPTNKGSHGGDTSSAFEWIADGDDRLGPVIEIILGGTYYWVPFEIVESLQVPVPKRAMELVWAPVELKLTGHPARIAYMPARYLPFEEKRSDRLLTGAETIWHETPGGTWHGDGRRVWYVDEAALDMFGAGRISLEH
jgi:type VI secretion system protein ImpE